MTPSIDDLERKGHLHRIPADDRSIGRLAEDARRHLATAEAALVSEDLAGAYQLAYDAARKSLTALLSAQGLRVKGAGAHAYLIAAVREAYGGTPGIEEVAKLDRLRRTRNQAEYEGYWFDRDEVADDMEIARAIVALVLRTLNRGS